MLISLFVVLFLLFLCVISLFFHSFLYMPFQLEVSSATWSFTTTRHFVRLFSIIAVIYYIISMVKYKKKKKN